MNPATTGPTGTGPTTTAPTGTGPTTTAPTGTGPATTAPTAEPTVAGRVGDARASIRRGMSGTPGRLGALALVTVAVCLLLAIGAFSALTAANDALRRGGDNAAQLVRIQAIHTNLVRADANASNAFLVGGLEPADQRTSYTAAMAQATRLITEAAQAQPADGRALGVLNSSVLTYQGLIEQARATNRQALPVGAQYLRVAGSGLRSDSLPILVALVEANGSRVGVELDRASGASAPLIACGVLALLVLLGGMLWLARRTHRYVNPPLAAATAAVLVTAVVGSIVLASVASRVSAVRDGSYAATLATATARIAAFDAKSNESLTLIARGSGTGFEKAWKASSVVVTKQSAVSARLTANAPRMGGLWNDYAKTHSAIRAADDGGQWEDAVQLATRSGARTANAAFDGFDTYSATALTLSSRAAADSLNAPRAWLAAAAWLGLLAGIAAAISAWWGVSLRLAEYR